MEFRLKLTKVMEKVMNFEIKTRSLGKVKEFNQQIEHFINWRHYKTMGVSLSCLYFGNFVIWSWKKVLEFCHGYFVATLVKKTEILTQVSKESYNTKIKLTLSVD